MHFRKKIRLRGFLIWWIVLSIATSLLLSSILSVILISAKLKNIKIAEEREKVEEVFSMMYKIMQKGATREEIIDISKTFSQKDSKLIYRDINNLDLNHPGLKEVIVNKLPNYKIKNGTIHFNYPIIIKEECISCHKKEINAILGIIDVETNLSRYMKTITSSILTSMLTSIITISTLLTSIIYLILKKFEKPYKIIEDVSHTIKDYSDINIVKQKLHEIESQELVFEEIREIISNMLSLINAIENVSTDKKILEVQVKLLEKLILTSELIKDWKDYINYFVSEVNKIVRICFLFSIFFAEDKSLEAEVFWIATPSEKFKNIVEEFIKKEIGKEYENYVIVKFIHNIMDNTDCYTPEDETQFETNIKLRTKKITVKYPVVGGIVGVGVTLDEMDPVKEMAIEMVLSSLMNFVGSVRALFEYTKELEFYATRDPLTHLYNHRMFLELANIEIEKCKRTKSVFSVILLDIDNFRFINNQWGHDYGNTILQEVTGMLKQTIRDSDIVARLSADDICILLPETEIEQAKSVAERIRETIVQRDFITPSGHRINITVSLAIISYPSHFTHIEDGLKLLSNLLRKAQDMGGNTIIVPDPRDIEEILLKLSEKTQLLIKTIEDKNIIPFWQPIVDLKTESVVGAELLMRIVKPDGSIVTAGEFIDIAESTGLINKLDMINIEKAFEQINKEKYDKFVFINISPKILVVAEFISTISDLIAKYQIDPRKIVIELTERDTIKNVRLISKFVKSLKNLNIKFCIDDFGTGYSSMKYLKMIPIDVIKIDGEFVLGLIKNGKIEEAVIGSTVFLAKHLNITTIAEYIENKDIMEICRSLGVDYGQGYFLGKPKPELPI